MQFDIKKYITDNSIPQNPFKTDDDVLNFLLRSDNWNNAVNTPLKLIYHISVPHPEKIPYYYNFQEAVWEILENIFQINTARWTGPNQENNVESRQSSYETYVDWKFTPALLKMKELINEESFDLSKAVNKFDMWIDFATFKKDLENLNNPSDVSIDSFPYLNKQALLKAIFQDHNIGRFELADIKNYEETNILSNQLIGGMLKLWGLYADIELNPSENDYQISLIMDIEERTYYPCIEKDDYLSDLFANHNENYLISSQSQEDNIKWNSGKTTYFEGTVGFGLPENFDYKNKDSITLSDCASNAFSEIHHGLAHTFLDHAVDNNLSSENIWEYFRTSIIKANSIFSVPNEIITNSYNPFSLCMTVLGTPNIGDCIVEGIEKKPITPMPLDIKALQYLYTAKCEKAPKTFEIDGKDSFNLFGFNIPEDAIFTLFACSASTLDLAKLIDTENIKIDLEPGAGHFNIVGENTFLFAYNTHVQNVYLPEKGNAVIYTSLNDDHVINLNHELHANIVLRNDDYVKVTLNNFDNSNHKIYFENEVQTVELNSNLMFQCEINVCLY